MLIQKIQDDLKNAMLGREELKTSVLRMLKSAIGYYEISKGGAGYTATDDDVLTVVEKEAKQRRDSIEQYTTARRQDLADKEAKELEILTAYLPKQMSENEIKRVIDDAVRESGVSSLQSIGKVMALIMPKVKGKADGGLISRIVSERLQNT